MKSAAKQSSARRPAASASVELHSLLVPVDLTPGSDRVLGRLSLFPLADEARVTLLHVVPGSMPLRQQRRAERDANRALAYEARHVRKQIHGTVSDSSITTLRHAACAVMHCRSAFSNPAGGLPLYTLPIITLPLISALASPVALRQTVRFRRSQARSALPPPLDGGARGP